jgi:hypothetical protein
MVHSAPEAAETCMVDAADVSAHAERSILAELAPKECVVEDVWPPASQPGTPDAGATPMAAAHTAALGNELECPAGFVTPAAASMPLAKPAQDAVLCHTDEPEQQSAGFVTPAAASMPLATPGTIPETLSASPAQAEQQPSAAQRDSSQLQGAVEAVSPFVPAVSPIATATDTMSPVSAVLEPSVTAGFSPVDITTPGNDVLQLALACPMSLLSVQLRPAPFAGASVDVSAISLTGQAQQSTECGVSAAPVPMHAAGSPTAAAPLITETQPKFTSAAATGVSGQVSESNAWAPHLEAPPHAAAAVPETAVPNTDLPPAGQCQTAGCPSQLFRSASCTSHLAGPPQAGAAVPKTAGSNTEMVSAAPLQTAGCSRSAVFQTPGLVCFGACTVIPDTDISATGLLSAPCHDAMDGSAADGIQVDAGKAQQPLVAVETADGSGAQIAAAPVLRPVAVAGPAVPSSVLRVSAEAACGSGAQVAVAPVLQPFAGAGPAVPSGMLDMQEVLPEGSRAVAPTTLPCARVEQPVHTCDPGPAASASPASAYPVSTIPAIVAADAPAPQHRRPRSFEAAQLQRHSKDHAQQVQGMRTSVLVQGPGTSRRSVHSYPLLCISDDVDTKVVSHPIPLTPPSAGCSLASATHACVDGMPTADCRDQPKLHTPIGQRQVETLARSQSAPVQATPADLERRMSNQAHSGLAAATCSSIGGVSWPQSQLRHNGGCHLAMPPPSCAASHSNSGSMSAGPDALLKQASIHTSAPADVSSRSSNTVPVGRPHPFQQNVFCGTDVAPRSDFSSAAQASIPKPVCAQSTMHSSEQQQQHAQRPPVRRHSAEAPCMDMHAYRLNQGRTDTGACSAAAVHPPIQHQQTALNNQRTTNGSCIAAESNSSSVLTAAQGPLGSVPRPNVPTTCRDLPARTSTTCSGPSLLHPFPEQQIRNTSQAQHRYPACGLASADSEPLPPIVPEEHLRPGEADLIKRIWSWGAVQPEWGLKAQRDEVLHTVLEV